MTRLADLAELQGLGNNALLVLVIAHLHKATQGEILYDQFNMMSGRLTFRMGWPSKP